MTNPSLFGLSFRDLKNPKHEWVTPTEQQEKDGMVIRKLFGDGREACIYAQLFNFKLCVYQTGSELIDDFWEYAPTEFVMDDQALLKPVLTALANWSGEGEPDGWIRHPKSGRRRPGGKKEKEYIHF